MLVKGSTLKGMKVIAKQVGKEINSIDDVLYNRDTGVVDALLISSGGMFKASSQVLKLRDVDSIGSDAIMIDSDNIIREVSADSIKNFKAKDILLGKKIVTEEGSQLGSVTDFFFDSESGQIQKYEVSEGVLNDLKGGRKEIDAAGISRVGDDTILVSPSVKEEVEAQPDDGGATALFNKAKAKTQETYDQVKEKVDEKRTEGEEQPIQQPTGPTIGMEDMTKYRTPQYQPAPMGASMNAREYPPVPPAVPTGFTPKTVPVVSPPITSSGPSMHQTTPAATDASVRADLDEMTQQASDAAERIKHEAQILKDFVTGTAEEIKDRLND